MPISGRSAKNKLGSTLLGVRLRAALTVPDPMGGGGTVTVSKWPGVALQSYQDRRSAALKRLGKLLAEPLPEHTYRIVRYHSERKQCRHDLILGNKAVPLRNCRTARPVDVETTARREIERRMGLGAAVAAKFVIHWLGGSD